MNQTDDFTGFMVVGERLAEPGSEVVIIDQWREHLSYYVTLRDVEPDGKIDMCLESVFEHNGAHYALLCSTPNLTVDDPFITYTVVEATSERSLVLVEPSTIRNLRERCEVALAVEVRERTKSLEQFFGTFREWQSQ